MVETPPDEGWESPLVELYGEVVRQVLHSIEVRRVCPPPWSACLDADAAAALQKNLEADRDYHQELEAICPEVADGSR